MASKINGGPLSSLESPTSSCSYAIPGVISQNSKSQRMASNREVSSEKSSVFQVPSLNLLHKGLNSKAPGEEIRVLGFQSLVLGRKESGTCFMFPYSVRNFSAQITNSAYNSMYNILSGYEAAGSRAVVKMMCCISLCLAIISSAVCKFGDGLLQ